MAWRKYTRDLLQEAVDHSTSVAGVLRYLGLNQAGGTHSHISRMIKKLEIDTSHFVRYPGSGRHLRLKPEDILVLRPRGTGRAKPEMLRRALLEINMPYQCAQCGLPGTWKGRRLILHIDHIDGDFHNNIPDNLRFLCPNCHSQTANFSGASRGKYTLIEPRGTTGGVPID